MAKTQFGDEALPTTQFGDVAGTLDEVRQPGFFDTLRNPLDLMYEESLVRQAYNIATGDTQKVQAQRALDYMMNNPDSINTDEFQNAQRIYDRFGYLLQEQPDFSFEALGQAISANPGQMAGELVNAFMADPYLIFTPYWLGANALAKFYQANKVTGKILSAAPRLSKGAAVGTIAVPEAAAYSLIMQKGEEDAPIDPQRLKVETTLGGAMGLTFGTVFAGSVNKMGMDLGDPNFNKVRLERLNARAVAGDAEAIKELNDFKMNEKGIPNNMQKLLDDHLDKIAGTEWGLLDKNAKALAGEIESDFAKNLSRFTKHSNYITAPAVAGLVFGTGAYIGTDDTETALKTAGVAAGIATFGKVSSRAFQDLQFKGLGKKFVRESTEDDFKLFKEELKDLGVDIKGTGIKDTITFYKDGSAKASDYKKLGLYKKLMNLKATTITRFSMDGYDDFTKVGNATSRRLNEAYNREHPIPKAREEALLSYIQTGKGKLSKAEIAATNAASNYFSKMHTVLSKETDLMLGFRKHYLPGFWQTSAFDSETSIMRMVQTYFTDSASAAQYKGKLGAENAKKINSYEEGIALGFKPRSTNLGDIIELYNNAVNKALGERRAVQVLFNSEIQGRVTTKGKPYKFMYYNIPEGVNASDYIQYKHPAFESYSLKNTRTLKEIDKRITEIKKQNPTVPLSEHVKTRNTMIADAYKTGAMEAPFVYKDALNHLRFMFDAREEKGLIRAISNINFLQKRFAVGYSFFHAAALMESMIFAGVGVSRALNVPVSYFKTKQNSAKRMINEGGNFDDYQIGLKSGVVFSHPDDIGHHRFYDTVQGANRLADRYGGPFAKWVANAGINNLVVKPFRFIDDVTWDHVYNSGKLYTFQTARQKLIMDPANKDIPLMELNRKAAQFTNDAYGGLNWRKLYEDVENPIMKAVTGVAITPSGRRFLQLAMFAPDWTTANLRILGNALPGFNKDPVARKLYQAYALRAGLIYATFGSALQLMFTGKSLLENKDPTKIDLGNGMNMVFSKQLMEPLHWAVHPKKTLISKQGSTLKLTQELLFNKKYLTSPYPSPITDRDLSLLYQARDYGKQIGQSFVPFAFRNPIQQMMKDGVDFQDAINFILGEFGHPVYPEGRKYKYPGLNIGR